MNRIRSYYKCISCYSKFPIKYNSYYTSNLNHESFMNASSSTYIEDMYNLWMADPTQVHASWNTYFRGVEAGRDVTSAYTSPPSFGTLVSGVPGAAVTPTRTAEVDVVSIRENLEVQSIIQSFRIRGHLVATLDPLGIVRGEHLKSARMQQYVMRHYKLPSDLNKKYMLRISDYIGGEETFLTVNEILKRLDAAYCGNIGVQYMHITEQEKYEFIREKFETPGKRNLTVQERRHILKRLIRASTFEEFLAKKFPSEKRFGLEGGEVLIPGVKTLVDTASSLGVDVFNIGIAHRGRLNMLANVLRKSLADIFAQFHAIERGDDLGSGDVKYHLGTSVSRINSQTNRPVTINVIANPSHLEAINPVVLGKTLADRNVLGDKNGDKVWTILVHGDAATTGQGVVYETFHLSELPCFTNNGSIHVVINNQIGFTTDPRVARSSEYCTEVAKVASAPVFHVNGDDPEAVCYVMKVAAEYKLKFKTDVVVDIVCYRRHGHSEADEPRFTQPIMYRIIKHHKPVHIKFAELLLLEKVVSEEDIKNMKDYSNKWLDDGFESAKGITKTMKRDWLDSPWKKFFSPDKDQLYMPKTGTSLEVLKKIGEAVSTIPPDFDIHPGLARTLKGRKDMIEKNSADWALGEAFAIGSLLHEGFEVRLTGQDVERGTFSHRHHVYHHQTLDQVTYRPIDGIFPEGGKYTVCNSSLSEFGVLAFQLGYSMVSPNCLVLWEAQFGDFANSAQIVIDQFISSGEDKWGRQSGLVMLLPHGLEGQGPEHSSARPERFLQMCTEPEPNYEVNMPQQLLSANWFIANPTTPANLFHVLRRQLKLNFRKPLVIFSPKAILRHPEAKSTLDEMVGDTTFRHYIGDDKQDSPSTVERVLLCTGKVFYELKDERQKRDLVNKVAVCRVEQLFPFPYTDVGNDLTKYTNSDFCWAQEEHRNHGWYQYIQPRLTHVLGRDIHYCGRPPSAPPSTGHKGQHLKEHRDLMDQCFNLS